MTYYLYLIAEANNTMFFWNRRKLAEEVKKEAEIQSVQKTTFDKFDSAVRSTEKAKHEIDKLLKDDVTLRIFYATGGNRSLKNGR